MFGRRLRLQLEPRPRPNSYYKSNNIA